jgi:tetratricopeptide (TPR) repeat protein
MKCTMLRLSWLLVLTAAGSAMAQDQRIGCGLLDNAYGPFDYSNPVHRRDNLPIVEHFHFTPSVESLRAGRSDTVAGDLDYTLRAFPNHHRALFSVARLQLQEKRANPLYYTADCYFDRAMRMAPEDGKVRMIYGIYLARKGEREAALVRYREALTLMPDSPEVNYNVGLLYSDMKQLELAKQHAIKAYKAGYPLPGLRNRLMRAGAWDGKLPPKAAAEPAVAGGTTPPPAQ